MTVSVNDLSVGRNVDEVLRVIDALQSRYASVRTIRGSFQQNYRAPGIEQSEAGRFWMKKPGLMRWEYRSPATKLFVADGHECFLYVPQDRQVTVYPLTAADLHSTPLSFFSTADRADKCCSAVTTWAITTTPTR